VATVSPVKPARASAAPPLPDSLRQNAAQATGPPERPLTLFGVKIRGRHKLLGLCPTAHI
jgi:hypothetical protein